MQAIGMILIASWAVIGILSPILGYAYDKLRGIKDSDSLFSTGRSEMRHSTLMILMFSLPLLVIGIILHSIGYYFIP